MWIHHGFSIVNDFGLCSRLSWLILRFYEDSKLFRTVNVDKPRARSLKCPKFLTVLVLMPMSLILGPVEMVIDFIIL